LSSGLRIGEGKGAEALWLNKPLATGYYMKEDLRELWNQPASLPVGRIKKPAAAFLTDRVFRAGTPGIAMLRKMAQSMAFHRFGILAYHDYSISIGPMEGASHKIKTMKR